MVMKFQASDNLIDLFVGQLIYTTPAASVRELLQNAYDACALQSVDHSDFKPSITAMISRSGNWFEVDDNGIGMDHDIVEQSFSMVGRPKSEIPSIAALIQKGGLQAAQIATFGVGVLSCFRIAQRVIVSTMMDGKQSLKFIIEDPKKEFEQVKDGLRQSRGTSVRVEVKPNIGFTTNDAYNAVFQFARHVDGLKITDSDSSTSQVVSQKYDGEDYPTKIALKNDDIRYGVIALNDGWESPTTQWSNSMRLDNGGFQVLAHDPSILPYYCFGYTTEIDFIPQRVQLMVNRENFVQDQKFSSIKLFLLEQYISLVESKIKSFAEKISSNSINAQEKQAVKDQLLVLEYNLPNDQYTQRLKPFVVNIIEKHVEFPLYGPSPKNTTLEEILNQGNTTIYNYNPSKGATQSATETFDEETTLQIIRQTITAERLKASLLALQGKPVFQTLSFSRPVTAPSGTYSLGYDLFGFLQRYCQSRNLRFIDMSQVPESEIKLQDTKLSAIMSSILNYSKTLKFMNLGEIKRPTFRDVDGSHWVNIANPEIRKLIKSVPEMVGNPIKKELLLIYFDLLTTDFSSARKKVENLLLNKDFEELSRQRTGVFQERYLRNLLDELARIEPNVGE